jgi:hypothetical protein
MPSAFCHVGFFYQRNGALITAQLNGEQLELRENELPLFRRLSSKSSTQVVCRGHIATFFTRVFS